MVADLLFTGNVSKYQKYYQYTQNMVLKNTHTYTHQEKEYCNNLFHFKLNKKNRCLVNKRTFTPFIQMMEVPLGHNDGWKPKLSKSLFYSLFYAVLSIHHEFETCYNRSRDRPITSRFHRNVILRARILCLPKSHGIHFVEDLGLAFKCEKYFAKMLR